MHFRRSYSETPDLLEQIFRLLDLSFPGLCLSAQERAARLLGCRWEEISTPFVYFEGNRPVAHVGVLEIPVVLEQREVRVAGVHAVCTHPDSRGRGLFGALMAEVLRWCDDRYETLLLTTSQPLLYEPFGFRVIPEHRFVSAWRGAPACGSMRKLDFQTAHDVAVLGRLLSERNPVSSRLGVRGEVSVFTFNEALRPLHYAEDLDLIISLEIAEQTLRIFDLVGTRIPSLREVVERIPARPGRVEVYFSPDRLDAKLYPERHILNDDDLLMVRGSFPPEEKTFMLPRSARC